MFPLAHLYIADKYFDHLTNEIKLGSIFPDILSLLPNFNIENTHVLLKDFKHKEFQTAWNLHVKLDKVSEEHFFYPKTPDHIKENLGEYLGHIFLETAFDYLLLEHDVFFTHPSINDNLIYNLERYLKKNLVFIKPIMKIFVTWKKSTYLDHLALSLLFICGENRHFKTKDQVLTIIEECKNSLPNFEESMKYFYEELKIIKSLDIY
jgi:hypothetical protein